MVRFVRLLAAVALAAGSRGRVGCKRPDGHARGGAAGDGTSADSRPRRRSRGRRRCKKRAKHPAPAGRQITVHARPSYLTAGTQVPVGSVGNGYVYDTFNQPTPIEGTFTGMRGRERIEDQFGNAATRVDSVQVLSAGARPRAPVRARETAPRPQPQIRADRAARRRRSARASRSPRPARACDG